MCRRFGHKPKTFHDERFLISRHTPSRVGVETRLRVRCLTTASLLFALNTRSLDVSGAALLMSPRFFQWVISKEKRKEKKKTKTVFGSSTILSHTQPSPWSAGIMIRSCFQAALVLWIVPGCVRAAARLYTEEDPLLILSSGSLKPTVTNSSSAWLVQFFSSWCGHCIHYSSTWKALAQDVKGARSPRLTNPNFVQFVGYPYLLFAHGR